jgi:hypothetical protein
VQQSRCVRKGFVLLGQSVSSTHMLLCYSRDHLLDEVRWTGRQLQSAWTYSDIFKMTNIFYGIRHSTSQTCHFNYGICSQNAITILFD